MKKRKTIIVLAIIMTLAAVLIIVFMLGRGGKAADIYVNGALFKRVPLDVNCEFTVETERGYNKIRVSDGCIGVIESDCPNKICVDTGMTDNVMLPVICVPHRLEIRVEQTDEY